MDKSDWEIVRSTPLFGNVPDEVIRSLVGKHPISAQRRGETLFRQGQQADSFFVVLNGLVKLFRLAPDGNEAVVGIFSRGQTFAEAVMFLGGRYPVTAEIVTDTRLLRVDGHHMRQRIREQPELAFSMLASASVHLKSLVDQIERIKLLSASQRVADFLLRLSAVSEGGANIELPYEKSLIANKLGMKPESFSRALAKLRPLGVSVERDRVTIVDTSLLFRFIQASDRGEEGF